MLVDAAAFFGFFAAGLVGGSSSLSSSSAAAFRFFAGLATAFGDLTAAGALALGFGFALAFAEEVDAFAFVAWASNQAAVMHEDKFRRTLGGITSRG